MEEENVMLSLLQRRNGVVSQTLDLDLVSSDDVLSSYTSLKDILPSTSTTVDSPAVFSAVSMAGPIRNRLVKQAACSYLQPSTPTPPSNPSFLSRVSSSLFRLFSAFFDSLLSLFPSPQKIFRAYKSAIMDQPPSPGTKSVNLRECMESLLSFTLRSHLDEAVPSLDLDLTRDLCLHLLEEETDSTGEKPAVYKLLARALSECLTSEEHVDKNPNLEKYREVFHGFGHDLVNMLKKVNFELHVQEPYFTQLKNGMKTAEGRCAVGDYNRISPGAFILFNKCLLLEVQDVHFYTSFSEMLRVEGLDKVLPGVESIEEGVQVYRNFYPEEKERMNGVVAILVAKPVDQPYVALAGVLSELKSTGIKSLLDDYTAQVTL
ncbi:hypothetical protein AALP_AA3G027600 [Arabis alpina]|uniref:ASCH domain-containing protein n=1 Tax=Arabis alpina TaxID=50452 RepID=A0A087H6M0_ARAAL|nr:hypothetical protein AALP_AA3G027600 [Arabis alpina]